MHTIVLGYENVISNGLNNTLTYVFPSPVNTEGTEVALSSAYLYYSWPNINGTTLNNNQFMFTVPPLSNDSTGAALETPISASTYTVTIPEGLYEIADINKYLQFFCIENNLYLLNTDTAEYVYFLQMEVNPTLYKVQFTSFVLPTSLPSGYTMPASGFAGVTGGAFPSVAGSAMGWQFPAAFNTIIGMTNPTVVPGNSTSNNYYTGQGSFPASNVTFAGDTCPQVQPNSVVHMQCSVIQNSYAQPQTFLSALTPREAQFGGLIEVMPPNFNWTKCLPGNQSQITITLTDRNSQPLRLLDPNITVSLIFRDITDKQLSVGQESVQGKPSSTTMLKALHHPNSHVSSGNTVAGCGFYRK